MSETIRATLRPIDPIMGPQDPVTHEVSVGEFAYDLNSVTEALVTLFRKFYLPNGGTLHVSGYGKNITWEHGGFLVPLAHQLLS